jgi:hypothetical protein
MAGRSTLTAVILAASPVFSVIGFGTRNLLKRLGQAEFPKVLVFAVRPDGAFHQWREGLPRELSIALVADERFGRVTGWIEAS